MPTPREVLTPDALAMLQTIASTGSFAAAARAGNLVPSALSCQDAAGAVADALRVADGGAAIFLDDEGHGGGGKGPR